MQGLCAEVEGHGWRDTYVATDIQEGVQIWGSMEQGDGRDGGWMTRLPALMLSPTKHVGDPMAFCPGSSPDRGELTSTPCWGTGWNVT